MTGDAVENESTEPGLGPAEAPVDNPLFLVQLCADAPFSRRSRALTRSGRVNSWGSCHDISLEIIILLPSLFPLSGGSAPSGTCKGDRLALSTSSITPRTPCSDSHCVLTAPCLTPCLWKAPQRNASPPWLQW